MSTNKKQSVKVLIAGVGGASLGTEIAKSLKIAGKYEIYGCDISSTAYGIYSKDFFKTFLVSLDNYIEDILELCKRSAIYWIIPGGEQPNALLGNAAAQFAKHGIRIVTNDSTIIKLLSNKQSTFEKLAALGIPIPKTVKLSNANDLGMIGLPCIVKPATGTGGSTSVFFATTADEALVYAEFINRNGSVPIAQEYISDTEGEFTIGVLSIPNRRVVGSIALRRVLDAKLSVAYRGRGGIISSGYSQGYIDAFPNLCQQAEKIAELVQSRGPINIQGRVRNGILLPFEINPRFSASTYLRALAGFNEVDIFLDFLISGEVKQLKPINPGWYLRSLTENYIKNF